MTGPSPVILSTSGLSRPPRKFDLFHGFSETLGSENNDIHNFSVSVGTEIMYEPFKKGNAVKQDIEIQTDPFEIHGGPPDMATSFGQTFLSLTNRSDSSTRSLNSSRLQFNNGGQVLELEGNDEVDFIINSGQDFILFDHQPNGL